MREEQATLDLFAADERMAYTVYSHVWRCLVGKHRYADGILYVQDFFYSLRKPKRNILFFFRWARTSTAVFMTVMAQAGARCIIFFVYTPILVLTTGFVVSSVCYAVLISVLAGFPALQHLLFSFVHLSSASFLCACIWFPLWTLFDICSSLLPPPWN